MMNVGQASLMQKESLIGWNVVSEKGEAFDVNRNVMNISSSSIVFKRLRLLFMGHVPRMTSTGCGHDSLSFYGEIINFITTRKMKAKQLKALLKKIESFLVINSNPEHSNPESKLLKAFLEDLQ